MNGEELRVIVSLTSYPARIKTVPPVIESLLAQTVKPWKIVLWLTKEEFPDGKASLPVELTALESGSAFEIDWAEENYRQYNKLVHALRKYPYCAIVTADDDIIYPADMMARLLDAHRQAPADIQSMYVRVMTSKNGVLQPFLDWLPTWLGSQSAAPASFDNSILGFGGALYPPKCLDDRAVDMAKAISICPDNDDFWFWAMAVLKGTKINGPSCNGYIPRYVASTGTGCLWTKNSVGGNDIQMRRLLEHFPEVKARLSLSHRSLPHPFQCCRGTILGRREGNRNYSLRISIPLFQMKYNEDFSTLTYYILRVPIWRRRCKKD